MCHIYCTVLNNIIYIYCNITMQYLYKIRISLIFIYPCIVNIIPNYNQQDASFLDLYISTDALHVSVRSSAHHQEHITVHTASGIVNQYCCLLLSWMRWNAVVQLVEALRYKPEGHGFDSRWCHWNFSLT